MVYKETKIFPKEEQFGLTNQMRRAAVSITSNIAEGFSRNSKKEKNRIYMLAMGSLLELQSQILTAKDLAYLDKDKYEHTYSQSTRVKKLLNGLIKSSTDYR